MSLETGRSLALQLYRSGPGYVLVTTREMLHGRLLDAEESAFDLAPELIPPGDDEPGVTVERVRRLLRPRRA
ncbi:MAG TPA: hypothetical protein PKE47_10510, partial [Verrucomicrobiota bacterium]|nr:hypothetical protein [Verrucomicrobiota bacterium]